MSAFTMVFCGIVRAGPYGAYDNTQLGPPVRLVQGYYGTRAFRKEKIPLLMPVSMETVRMATPNHLLQYNNHIVLTEQDSPWENRWELFL